MSENKTTVPAWAGGKCRVPMWFLGGPAGYCDNHSFGPKYPIDYLTAIGVPRDRIPYCHGPCCPAHFGPKEGHPVIFQDGWTNSGRPMWCAVMPGFENLQESNAAFDSNPSVAVKKLMELVR